jgi:hypothetical protein
MPSVSGSSTQSTTTVSPWEPTIEPLTNAVNFMEQYAEPLFHQSTALMAPHYSTMSGNIGQQGGLANMFMNTAGAFQNAPDGIGGFSVPNMTWANGGLDRSTREGMTPTASGLNFFDINAMENLGDADWAFHNGPFNQEAVGDVWNMALDPLAQAGEAYTQGIDQLGRNMNYIDPIARGDFLSGSNPYLQDILTKITDDTTNSIAGQFSNAGRMFSGAYSDAMGEGLAEGLASPLFNNYQNEVARQMNALQLQSQGAGMYNTFGGGLTNLGTAYSNLAATGGNLANSYLQGGTGLANAWSGMSSGLLGRAAGGAGMVNPYMSNVGQIGGMPWIPMQNYVSNYVTPMNQMGSSYPKTEMESTTIGGGVGMSDRRTKDNIKKIGETYDGQTIYSFTYKGLEGTHIGLMADEVERVYPDAVREGKDGFKRVDYALATENAAIEGAYI